MLPNLSALSKTFQTGSLNFSRIVPSINICKSKILEIESNGKILNELKKDCRLAPLQIILTSNQEDRIRSLISKYIRKNIDERFPLDSCGVLSSFSIFDIDLLPSQSSPAFLVFGKEELLSLHKQYYPENSKDMLLEQWNDFKFELIEMKEKFINLKKQLKENNIQFKMTATEWTLEHILKRYKEEVSFPVIIELAKIAITIPVTNAWPERGASAVKRIKTRQRSTMKNDILNALLHISMNGPPVNSSEEDDLLTRVVEKYCEQRQNKVPNLYVNKKQTSTIQTQTIEIEVEQEMNKLENIIEDKIDYITTNFNDSDSEVCSSSNCENDNDA